MKAPAVRLIVENGTLTATGVYPRKKCYRYFGVEFTVVGEKDIAVFVTKEPYGTSRSVIWPWGIFDSSGYTSPISSKADILALGILVQRIDCHCSLYH